MQTLSPLENAALGVSSAFPIIAVCQPLLYLKTATQQGLPKSINPRILYRGSLANLINECWMNGGQFVLNGVTQRIVTGGKPEEMNYWKQNVAAGSAGAMS